MRKVIQVKQKHIKRGTRCKVDMCPVALAIKDSGYGYAIVTVYFMRVYINSERFHADTPRSVKRFIDRFDSKKSVKPFNFILTYKE